MRTTDSSLRLAICLPRAFPFLPRYSRSFRAPVPNAETAIKLKGFDAAGMRSMNGALPRLSPPRKTSIVEQTIPEEDENYDFQSGNEEQQHADGAQPGSTHNTRLPQTRSASRIYLMGSAGDVDWTAVMREDEALARGVTEALLNYYDVRPILTHRAMAMSLTYLSDQQQGRTEYGQASPLVTVLPHSVSSTCIIPVFDEGVPSLLLVLASSGDKFHTFVRLHRRFRSTSSDFTTFTGGVRPEIHPKHWLYSR